MSKASLAFVILTKNEAKHIGRCIGSIKDVADDILVVDCYSTDATVEIAAALGARVVQHEWKCYADQINFAITECGIASDWIWRIDADEYLTGGLGEAVKEYIQSAPETVNGIYVKRRIDFLGRPLMHGGWYPCHYLKVWRRGYGICENRWMDEHIILNCGDTVVIDKGDQVDANLNDLSWWTEKHNGYSSREMVEMLLMEYGLDDAQHSVKPSFWGTSEQRKRWLKKRYLRFPLFLRALINFNHRYFFKLGFLDGKEGFIWHILQGFWYRTLVDAKIYELKKSFGFDDERIESYLKEKFCSR